MGVKELSIEEKAKAYNELIERLKDLKFAYRFSPLSDTIEEKFPELKESKDAGIRKALIDYFKWNPNSQLLNEFSNREVLAYLEKQGENNMGISEATKKKLEDNLNKALEKETPESWNEFLDKQGEQKTIDEIAKEVCKDKISAVAFLKSTGIINEKGELAEQYRQDDQKTETNILKFRKGDKVTNGEDIYTIDSIDKDCYWVKEHDCSTIPFEYQHHWKLVEQKPTDKVEQKFHEGDWIISNNAGNPPLHITNITDKHYIFSERDSRIKIEDCNNSYHLWSLKDAKDGDVLINWNNTIFIFKNIEDESVKFHIAYNEKWDVIKTPSTKSSHMGLPEPQFEFHPATKEQRDTLIKAMTDAGYTFDFEKKELKKIVVPIFNIGDTIAKKHNSDIHDFGSFTITDITGGKYWYNDRIICNISEQDEWEIYEPVRQNPTEWSEEDEYNYNTILHHLDLRKEKYKKECNQEEQDRYQGLYDWLKSLKDRCTWKPSDEQMNTLRLVISGCSYDIEPLVEMEEQLKKLRENKV